MKKAKIRCKHTSGNLKSVDISLVGKLNLRNLFEFLSDEGDVGVYSHDDDPKVFVDKGLKLLVCIAFSLELVFLAL